MKYPPNCGPYILGVDPGKSGGLALCGGFGADPKAWKMPETEADLVALLRGDSMPAGVFAYIEKVHAMPRQGVSSTFKFGMNYGGLRMALVACGIPFETVTPAKWQRAMSCLSKGDKNVTKRRAQELFPSIEVTHALADSLLIAEYGRRVRTQEIAA